MAILINYRYQRNPRHLLQLCGMSSPQNLQEEKSFLAALAGRKELRTLLLVVGGFQDGKHGRAYNLTQSMPATVNRGCDIFYREHDEGREVRALLELYAVAGQRVILIGHSWGGSCAVMDGVAKTAAPVTLLVTIDPVGYRRPRHPYATVQRWINIFIDYAHAPATINNITARIGSPWENVPFASENFCSVFPHHNMPLEMLEKYAMLDILDALPPETVLR